MAKASPIITAFNAGEISPLMAGRVDIKYYAHGCRRSRNFIITKQGPARRRPATRFVAEVKDSTAQTWLGTFIFNVLQAYVLEFGNQYIRFYSNHGVVGAPLEVVTPYTSADLTNTDGTFALRFVQSNDVLYVVHPKYAPRKLQRTGAAAFNLATLAQIGGPFDKVDPANAITMVASANTGNITVTAAGGTPFQAAHVGCLIYLEQKLADGIAQWEAGKAVGINAVRRSDGKNYHALNAATTGTVKPVHNAGARFDGDTGVQWQYDDPGYGWAVITGFTDNQHVNATVLSRIPDGALAATTKWALGTWNDINGYPDNVTFWRERLVFSKNRTIWESQSGDYENFKAKTDDGLVTDACAITSDVTSDKANNLQWLAPSDIALLAGTAGDETMLAEISNAQPLGPGNIKARKQMEYGSRHVPICRAGESIIFVQNSGRKVRDAQFSWQKEGYISSDLTVLAEHVTKGGIIDMCYQQEPDSNVWCVRADGALLGLTLDKEQDVKGWHPHRIGGYADAAQKQFAIVESVVSIPAPNNDRNEVWMIVRRYVNGRIVRYVEWMEKHLEEGDDPHTAFYTDCGLTLNNTKDGVLTPGVGANVKGTAGVNFNSAGGTFVFQATDPLRKIVVRYSTTDITGKVTWLSAIARVDAFVDAHNVTCTILQPFPNGVTPIAASGWKMTTSTVSGLNHLIGQTVQLWCDGASHPDQVVDGTGKVTLQIGSESVMVHVGLACPAVLQPMPIEAGAGDGTARGKKQRASRVGIGFHNTYGVLYGRDELAPNQLDRVMSRAASDNMDEAPPLFTGIKTVDWPDGYDDSLGLLITIIADQPGPCTVTMLAPQMMTMDGR